MDTEMVAHTYSPSTRSSQRQEDLEFQARLGYIERPSLKK